MEYIKNTKAVDIFGQVPTFKKLNDEIYIVYNKKVFDFSKYNKDCVKIDNVDTIKLSKNPTTWSKEISAINTNSIPELTFEQFIGYVNYSLGLHRKDEMIISNHVKEFLTGDVGGKIGFMIKWYDEKSGHKQGEDRYRGTEIAREMKYFGTPYGKYLHITPSGCNYILSKNIFIEFLSNYIQEQIVVS